MMNRNEFEKSLSSPCDYWQNKTSLEVAELMGLYVARMVDYDQNNPHHCYDLFSHSLHTVENILVNEPSLKVAAFFHDIGKPDVAMEKEGRFVFYNHPKSSVAITEPILNAMGYSMEESQLICFWIEHHDDFINWRLSVDINKNPNMVEINLANLKRHIIKYQNHPVFKKYDSIKIWEGLIALCRADCTAQADFVYKNDRLVNSKERKLNRIDKIRCLLERIFKN